MYTYIIYTYKSDRFKRICIDRNDYPSEFCNLYYKNQVLDKQEYWIRNICFISMFIFYLYFSQQTFVQIYFER